MRSYSQFGEDTIFVPILEAIGIENGVVTDVGSGDGWNMSNARALIEKGWEAHLYDGDAKGNPDVNEIWITRDTAADIHPCDFLSLDIDGNDWWIMQTLLNREDFNPSLIVCEINPAFPRDVAKTIAYDPDHTWKEDTFYGCTLAAYEKLMDEYGYALIYLHKSLNAFFLRNDHLIAHPELRKPIEFQQKRDHKPHPPEKEALWITL